MKLNIEDVLAERNKIVNSFNIPLRHIPLVASDIDAHKCHVEKVYRGMLHEKCVIDDCCRRFKRTFEEPRFMIV